MSDFLTTSGISNQLEETIKGANERILIISPYLQTNRQIRELLEERDRFKIDIRVIYGKSELKPDESKWLESVSSIRTSFYEHLHAKCYMNEKQALITSMNLYDFSQTNNREMGILVTRDSDPDLYEKIYEEARRILQASQDVNGVSPAKVEAAKTPTRTTRNSNARAPQAPSRSPAPAVATGHCIRCNKTIPLNVARPYCPDDFTIWNKFKKNDHEEKFCHRCGKENRTSMAKPECRNCYKK